MKKLILNSSIHLIEDNFPNYNSEQLDAIRYGLEGVYILITKLVVIFSMAYFLGIFKEAIILLLFFNLLRMTAFGLHASKSWMCWISSSIVFIGCPLLCIHLVLPLWSLVTIAGICFVNLVLYAPADTVKRPLVNKKKRTIYKIVTLVTACIYFLLLFFIESQFLKNTLVCSMIIQVVLIHPLVYKLFRLPYNNYKSYVFSK